MLHIITSSDMSTFSPFWFEPDASETHMNIHSHGPKHRNNVTTQYKILQIGISLFRISAELWKCLLEYEKERTTHPHLYEFIASKVKQPKSQAVLVPTPLQSFTTSRKSVLPLSQTSQPPSKSKTAQAQPNSSSLQVSSLKLGNWLQNSSSSSRTAS